MPQKRTNTLYKSINVYLTAMALFAFVVFLFLTKTALFNSSAVAAEENPSDEEDTRKEYEFDLSNIFCVRNENDAAVYFVSDPDTDVEFRFVCEDSGIDIVQSSPYFSGFEGSESRAVLHIVRASDEEYKEYVSEELEFVTVTDGIIRLPDGQRKAYDGRAASFGDAKIYTAEGTESEALNVGKYLVELSYTGADEEPIEKRVEFSVVPADVGVTPRTVSRKYLEIAGLNGINVNKALPRADIEYIEENTVLTLDERLNENSPVGEYDIYAEYRGSDPNFNITTSTGVYRIIPADLTGFVFDDMSVKYDGKPHRLTVKYDEAKWRDVSVEYDVEEVTDIGKYRCSALVKKVNYTDLTLRATLVIKSEYLESGNMLNYVRLSGDENWYDPDISVSLDKSDVLNLEEAVGTVLAADGNYREEIVASYDVNLIADGQKIEVSGDEYTLMIKLKGLDSAVGIRILQSDGVEVQEAAYTFDNGYFVIKTDSLEGLVFVKNFKVQPDSASALILSAIIGIVILILILTVFAAIIGAGKDRRRSRRRHSRWA